MVTGRTVSYTHLDVYKRQVNKQYVDYSCLRFTQLAPNKKNGAVVDARDHRVQSLREPIRAREAATKVYVHA